MEFAYVSGEPSYFLGSSGVNLWYVRFDIEERCAVDQFKILNEDCSAPDFPQSHYGYSDRVGASGCSSGKDPVLRVVQIWSDCQ